MEGSRAAVGPLNPAARSDNALLVGDARPEAVWEGWVERQGSGVAGCAKEACMRDPEGRAWTPPLCKNRRPRMDIAGFV